MNHPRNAPNLSFRQPRMKPIEQRSSKSAGRSHWLMAACCLPMVALVVALVATGVVSAGFLIVAGMCVTMMGLMMFAMMR